MLGLTLLFIATGVVMIALAIPLMRRRVKPNSIYGLRIPATFADEWVWYEANARSGRDLMVLGFLLIATPIILALIPGVTPDLLAGISSAVAVAGAIVCAVVGWRRATRLLDSRKGP
jgi:uncharacterized membrane protein